MIDPNPVIIVLDTSKIRSINEYLLPSYKTHKHYSKSKQKWVNKVVPFLYKNPDISAYQESIVRKLRKIVSNEDKLRMRKWKWYKVQLELVFNTAYDSRDADNAIKSIMDALFYSFLRKDDKYIRDVRSIKYSNPENKKEYIIITVSEVKDDRYLYN